MNSSGTYLNGNTFSTNSEENFLSLGGCELSANPFSFPGYVSDRPLEEMDSFPLTKLRSTGMAVESLEEAYRLYGIGHVRTVEDLSKLLCWEYKPDASRYNSKNLTALAFLYPDLRHPGQVFKHTKYIRVRFSNPLIQYDKKTGETKELRYEQIRASYRCPVTGEKPSNSEPYLVNTPEMLSRVFDVTQPLFITEGELKAISLSLAGFAAIAWGGAQSFYGPKKGGEHALHPSLDEHGERKNWHIPIRGRYIYLVPDNDIVGNAAVKKAFSDHAKLLLRSGAQAVHILNIPQPPADRDWKGIDDYLLAHLELGWAGNEESRDEATRLIQELVANSSPVSKISFKYRADSPERGAYLLLEKLNRESTFTRSVIDEKNGPNMDTWVMSTENGTQELITLTNKDGSTYPRTAFDNDRLYKLVQEVSEESDDIAIAEGDKDPTQRSQTRMESYQFRLVYETNKLMEKYSNNTMLLGESGEPIKDTSNNDFLIRVNDGLINFTRMLSCKNVIEERGAWLLPHNRRWLSTSRLNINLGQVEKFDTPLWDDFLNHVFIGDPSRINMMLRCLARCVFSPFFTSSQQMTFLYGPPASGKSTIVRLLRHILMDNNVASLRAKEFGRFGLSNIMGKKLLVIDEIPDSGKLSEELCINLKKITGGDNVILERKFSDELNYKSRTEILITGNAAPYFVAEGPAMERRSVFIETSEPFINRSANVEKAIVENELVGIFYSLLQKARDMVDENCFIDGSQAYTTPQVSRGDLETACITHADQQDRFISEELERDEDSKISTADLLDHYKAWLRGKNVSVEVNPVSFGKAMKRMLGMDSVPRKDKHGSSARFYVGLRFVNCHGMKEMY